jgi:hypothetical protein
METTIQYIQENWQSILTGLAAMYEVTIRLIPTSKSWSGMTIAGRVFNALLPDRRTEK